MMVLVAIRSVMPDVAVPLMPLTDFVFRDMKNFGDRPALVSLAVLFRVFWCIYLVVGLYVSFLFLKYLISSLGAPRFLYFIFFGAFDIVTTSTPVYWPLFHDNLGKPVPER